MIKNIENVLLDLPPLVLSNADFQNCVEEALMLLKQKGYSMAEATIILRKKAGVDLGTANDLVADSQAWRHLRNQHTDLQNLLWDVLTGNNASAKILAKELEDNNLPLEDKINIIEALSDIGEDEITYLLLNHLNDPNDEVRAAVLKATGKATTTTKL